MRREREAVREDRTRRADAARTELDKRYRRAFVLALEHFTAEAGKHGCPKAERLKYYTTRKRGILSEALFFHKSDLVTRAHRTRWKAWYLCDNRRGLRDPPRGIWLATGGDVLMSAGLKSKPRDYDIYVGERRQVIGGMVEDIGRFARRLESDLAGIWDEGVEVFDLLDHANKVLFGGGSGNPDALEATLDQLERALRASQ